ncbi:ATP-dependent DNA ligase [Microbacterium sp. Root61]|uniref:DUF7882 family protein n=1 Tax=Microbacterium sp. Root61 TaxID=1736570 RepID=UPI0006F658B5|nr:hypothetical protein [Microbacterium sp. Root61]KRA24023.1 ATP-dependent DNA ligase [Microbacterium sp. Root61]
MGRFIYDTMGNAVDIDDRTLAHLRVVVMNKLRRSESFMFDVEIGDGSGRRSFWMHPSVPLQFHFFGSRAPALNREWIEELMISASSPSGLVITPEPAEGVTTRENPTA